MRGNVIQFFLEVQNRATLPDALFRFHQYPKTETGVGGFLGGFTF